MHIVLYYTVVYYSIVCCSVCYGMLCYGMVWYGMVWYMIYHIILISVVEAQSFWDEVMGRAPSFDMHIETERERCMFVYSLICISTYTHVYVCVYIYIYIHVYAHICTYIHMHICIYCWSSLLYYYCLPSLWMCYFPSESAEAAQHSPRCVSEKEEYGETAAADITLHGSFLIRCQRGHPGELSRHHPDTARVWLSVCGLSACKSSDARILYYTITCYTIL